MGMAEEEVKTYSLGLLVEEENESDLLSSWV